VNGCGAPYYKTCNMAKVKLLKAFRKHSAGDTIEADGLLLEGLLRRKIAQVVKETKEEKAAYETKSKRRTSNVEKR